MSTDEDRLRRVTAKLGLKEALRPLHSDDYYRKNTEFGEWLRREKSKYVADLSGKEAHRYFDKFVSRWNRGHLDDDLYRGLRTTGQVGATTKHQWSFASKLTAEEAEKLASVRDSLEGRHVHSHRANEAAAGPSQAVPIGPSLPSHLERLQYQRDLDEEDQRARRSDEHESKKRRRRREDDFIEEISPRDDKRERPALEKREALNAKMRDFRDRDSTRELEMSESMLYGGGNDFEATKRRLELQSQSRRDMTRQAILEEKKAAIQDRVKEMKAKESATVEMLKALAKERFG